MRRLTLLLAVTTSVLFAPELRASDPPHWSSVNDTIDCTSACHFTHDDLGGSLTSASNVNLCQSCHNPSGKASAFSISDADAAIPGVRGTSHAFGVSATNAAAGALPPIDDGNSGHREMSLRLPSSQIICSTCHDQHAATSAFGGTARVSPAQHIVVVGTGTMTSGGTFTGTPGMWYLIEITGQGSATTASFHLSKDNGGSWEADQTANTSPVTLTNGFGVTVTFTGAANTLKVGDRWQFSASWPFLRAGLDSGDNASGTTFCRHCHRDNWTNDLDQVRLYDGGNKKSHPVGVALGAVYDRPTPLDGNGVVQGDVGDDTNASNDLLLYGGSIQCLTCHGVHHADSNSQTEDGP